MSDTFESTSRYRMGPEGKPPMDPIYPDQDWDKPEALWSLTKTIEPLVSGNQVSPNESPLTVTNHLCSYPVFFAWTIVPFILQPGSCGSLRGTRKSNKENIR